MMRRIILSEALATAPVEAAVVIAEGGVAVVPTDTVYGLVCDAHNEDAVKRMFAIKRRPQERAFPIFVRDIAMARRYAYISDAKARFLKHVWPGAVTFIFYHKEKLPAVLTGGKDTVGIRIPDHPFATALLARADSPLAETSANISDMPPAKNREEIRRYFENESALPDLVIDAGEISGAPSVVIDCSGASPLILRSGIMSKADIDRMLENFLR